MDSNYVFLCGVMWRQYRSDDARSELMRAIGSDDVDIACMARAMLQERPAEA